MAGSPKAATRLDARGVPIVFPSNNNSAAPPLITASNNNNNGKRSRTHSRQTSMNSPCNSPSKRRIRTPSRQLTMENEADEIQLYKSRALSTTPKQDRSLLDEYDAYSDAYHKSYINHINKMFGPASQVHSSPNSLQDASTEPIPLSAKNSPISSPHIYNNNNNNNNSNNNSNSNMRNSLHFIMNDTNVNNNNNNNISGNFNSYNNNNSINNYNHTTTIQCPPNKVSPFPSSPHKRLEAVRQYRQKHPYISPTRPTIRNDRFNPDHLMANDIFRMDENSLSERFRKNPLNFTFQFNDTQEENSSFGTIIKPIPSDNFSTVNISSSQNQSQNQNENQNENNNHNHNNHITPMLNSIEHATHTPLIIDPYHHINSKSGTLLKENEINNNNHDDMNNSNLVNDKNEINIDLDNNSDLYNDQQKSISIVIPEPNTESQNLDDDHDHKDNTDTMNNMKQTEEQNMNENKITDDHNISLPNDLKNKSSSTHNNNNNNSNNETIDNNNENENENNNKIGNDNGQEVEEDKTNINNDKENDNMNEKQFTPIEPTPSEQINVNTNNNATVTNTTNITKPLEESQQNANQQQKDKKLNVDENHHRHDKNENVDKETEKEEKLQTEKMEREMIQKEIDHLNRSVKHLSTHYKLIERIGYGTFGTVYKAKDLQNSIGQYYQKLKSAQTKTSSSSSSSQSSSQSSPSQPFCSSLAMLSPLSLNQEEMSNSTTCDHSPPLSSSSSNDKTEFVALKHIYSLSSPQRMGHEIKVLHELRGASCVAPLISAFRQDDNIFMVMPYFEHDDFRDCYRNMSMLDIKHYFISLLTALKNIHKKSIIHRDVKPNNFLYNMKLKTGMLIDFGLAQKEASDLPKSVRSTYHSLVKENTLKSFKPFESTSVFSEFLNGIKPTKPGYFRNDYREHAKGNRGGTRGFRAPEVLLRVKHQTVSIDIWSVGVILLSVLTGRYPFFVAQDEGDSLLEFANIFGLKEMKECAALYNRTFDTNIETLPKTRISLRKLCQVLNTEKFKLWTKENKEDIMNALNLLEKLLTLDYTERITAEEALMHPFLIL